MMFGMRNKKLDIYKKTKQHCAAIFTGLLKESIQTGIRDSLHAQGTMTFVKYKDKCFGVTNYHVIEDYLTSQSKPKSEMETLCLGLKRQEKIFPDELLFYSTQDEVDFPFDIAIFSISEQKLEFGGKVPIELGSHKLKEEELALSVGFAGDLRKKYPEGIQHGLAHVASTVKCASDRLIVLNDCKPNLEASISFGGMSGGPIYKVIDDDNYFLIGINFEGSGPEDKDEYNDFQDDIWIYGFPLNVKVILNKLDELSN